MILDAAPAGFDQQAPIDIDRLPGILADRILPSGRHLVVADDGGPHRIWLRDPSLGRPLAYLIVRDRSIAIRRQAAWRLERRLAGEQVSRSAPDFRPTAFQRQRLSLLLDILDLVGMRRRGAPTTHEIARCLVYPRMTIGRGAEWKSSSERRRTQRLIDEALALRNGGYRALLRGERAGATKNTARK